jgi:hypothetical protein
MSERRAYSEHESAARAPGHGAGRLPRRRQPLPIQEACEGLHACCVSVEVEEVVFVKGIIEASDGLAAVFAERGGDLVIAAPIERRDELSELLNDLARDIGAKLSPHGAWPVPRSAGEPPDRSVQTHLREDDG